MPVIRCSKTFKSSCRFLFFHEWIRGCVCLDKLLVFRAVGLCDQRDVGQQSKAKHTWHVGFPDPVQGQRKLKIQQRLLSVLLHLEPP